MTKLDREEKEILDAFEAGKLKPAKRASDTQQRHKEYADAMFRKDARINIRLPSKDLRGLQKRAIDGVILTVFGHFEIAVDCQARMMHGLQGSTVPYFNETHPQISLLQ